MNEKTPKKNDKRKKTIIISFIIVLIIVFILFILITSSVVTTFLILNSGKDKKDNDKESVDYDIKPNVKNMEDYENINLIEVDNSTLIYRTNSTYSDINEGDILSSAEGNGFLREVTSVEFFDSIIKCETRPIFLPDAVENGRVETKLKFNNNAIYKGPESKSISRSGIGADINNEIILENESLSIKIDSGHICFDPELNLDFSISSGEMDHFKLTAIGELEFDIDASLIASDCYYNYNKEFTVGSYSQRFTQMIGFVPVVEFVTLSFIVGVEVQGDYNGSLSVGFESTNSITIGAEYNDEQWTEIRERNSDFIEHAPTWSYHGGIRTRIYAKPEIQIAFYGIAGPYLNAVPYLDLNGEIEMDSFDWELVAGIESNIGFSIEALGYEIDDFSTQLFQWETTLAQGHLSINDVVVDDDDSEEKLIEEIAGVDFEFVSISSGSFMMGSPSDEGDIDEHPQHSVTITNSFEMLKHEVTQEQWEAVMGSNPSYCFGDSNPVEQVSWNDCQDFIDALNSMDPDHTYRLPTEAEWEYACRAGGNTNYFYGDGTGSLGDYAWYINNSDNKTHPVGQKLPNAWGLYDMHGNVGEWCSDWYDGGYYEVSPGTDPQGPGDGYDRVFRGGTWFSDGGRCRSALRNKFEPGLGAINSGLRLVRS